MADIVLEVKLGFCSTNLSEVKRLNSLTYPVFIEGEAFYCIFSIRVLANRVSLSGKDDIRRIYYINL